MGPSGAVEKVEINQETGLVRTGDNSMLRAEADDHFDSLSLRSPLNGAEDGKGFQDRTGRAGRRSRRWATSPRGWWAVLGLHRLKGKENRRKPGPQKRITKSECRARRKRLEVLVSYFGFVLGFFAISPLFSL